MERRSFGGQTAQHGKQRVVNLFLYAKKVLLGSNGAQKLLTLLVLIPSHLGLILEIRSDGRGFGRAWWQHAKDVGRRSLRRARGSEENTSSEESEPTSHEDQP
jgi:hypothetical protein